MNILIVNQHTLNFGDDLAGISLINNLKTQFDINKIDLIYNTKGTLPINDKKIFHNRDITLKKIGIISLINYFVFGKLFFKFYSKPLKKFLNLIENADYIFVSPCGANIGIYKDWRFLIKLLIVIKERKSPIFYLNTIGKSNSLIFDFLAKKVLKKSILYVREKRSFDYLKSLGIEAKLGVDTAFSFEYNKKIEKKNKLVFIPTVLLNWHPLYKNKKVNVEKILFEDVIPNLAVFCKENKLYIELVPHLNSVEEEQLYKKVKEFLKKFDLNVELRNDVKDVYNYYDAIASSKFVVAMRYHSLIVAAKNNIPFVSLSYENKMEEVCNYCGVSEYSIKLFDYQKDDRNNVNILLQQLNKNYNVISEKLMKNHKNMIKLSKIPLEQIRS